MIITHYEPKSYFFNILRLNCSEISNFIYGYNKIKTKERKRREKISKRSTHRCFAGDPLALGGGSTASRRRNRDQSPEEQLALRCLRFRAKIWRDRRKEEWIQLKEWVLDRIRIRPETYHLREGDWFWTGFQI